MLFHETITASELRENQKEHLEGVKGSNVLQIIHRGQPIRVLMTQEHYLNLLGRLAASTPLKEKFEDIKTVPHMSADEMAARVLRDAEERDLKSKQRLEKPRTKHG